MLNFIKNRDTTTIYARCNICGAKSQVFEVENNEVGEFVDILKIINIDPCVKVFTNKNDTVCICKDCIKKIAQGEIDNV